MNQNQAHGRATGQHEQREQQASCFPRYEEQPACHADDCFRDPAEHFWDQLAEDFAQEDK